MEIKVNKSTKIGQKPRPLDAELGFGRYTTDHMFLLDYTQAEGWHCYVFYFLGNTGTQGQEKKGRW